MKSRVLINKVIPGGRKVLIVQNSFPPRSYHPGAWWLCAYVEVQYHELAYSEATAKRDGQFADVEHIGELDETGNTIWLGERIAREIDGLPPATIPENMMTSAWMTLLDLTDRIGQVNANSN